METLWFMGVCLGFLLLAILMAYITKFASERGSGYEMCRRVPTEVVMFLIVFFWCGSMFFGSLHEREVLSSQERIETEKTAQLREAYLKTSLELDKVREEKHKIQEENLKAQLALENKKFDAEKRGMSR